MDGPSHANRYRRKHILDNVIQLRVIIYWELLQIPYSRRTKIKYLVIAAGGAALVMQLLIIVAALVLAARINLYILEAPRLDLQELTMAQTTYLYDGDDAEIAALHGEQNRVCLPLEEIPLQVQQAFGGGRPPLL